MGARRGWVVPATLIALSALASTPAHATEPNSGEITGVVLAKGASATKPLAGVSVCATNEQDQAATLCATSDESGEYLISTLPAGEYTVQFAPPPGSGYLAQYYADADSRSEARPVPVAAGYATTQVNAILQPTTLGGPPLQQERPEVPAPVNVPNTGLTFPMPPALPADSQPAPELAIVLPSPLSRRALSALSARCQNAACQGAIKLLTHKTADGWSKQEVVLGSATFSLEAERLSTIAVRLTRTGRMRLARTHHRLSAYLVVTLRGGATHTTVVSLT